jgi:RimJ/RimL family protein N-acetyltransferase
VRSLEDARRYIEQGPMKMYAERGFGLWLVERTSDGSPLGICGLVKREQLEDVDLGFAFLPRYWSQGYAHEAATGVLEHAREAVGLKRVVAITSPDNRASSRLLEKLGFAHEATLDWGRADPVMLYGTT